MLLIKLLVLVARVWPARGARSATEGGRSANCCWGCRAFSRADAGPTSGPASGVTNQGLREDADAGMQTRQSARPPRVAGMLLCLHIPASPVALLISVLSPFRCAVTPVRRAGQSTAPGRSSMSRSGPRLTFGPRRDRHRVSSRDRPDFSDGWRGRARDDIPADPQMQSIKTPSGESWRCIMRQDVSHRLHGYVNWIP